MKKVHEFSYIFDRNIRYLGGIHRLPEQAWSWLRMGPSVSKQGTQPIPSPTLSLTQRRSFANCSCLNPKENCSTVAGCASLHDLLRLSLIHAHPVVPWWCKDKLTLAVCLQTGWGTFWWKYFSLENCMLSKHQLSEGSLSLELLLGM